MLACRNNHLQSSLTEERSVVQRDQLAAAHLARVLLRTQAPPQEQRVFLVRLAASAAVQTQRPLRDRSADRDVQHIQQRQQCEPSRFAGFVQFRRVPSSRRRRSAAGPVVGEAYVLTVSSLTLRELAKEFAKTRGWVTRVVMCWYILPRAPAYAFASCHANKPNMMRPAPAKTKAATSALTSNRYNMITSYHPEAAGFQHRR